MREEEIELERAKAHHARLSYLHQARLAARSAALRRLRSRSIAGALLLIMVLGGVGARFADQAADVFTSIAAHTAWFDELTVRGALHVVDENGRELAYLGQEGKNGGPIVLNLFSPESPEPRQTLRMAATASGSAISMQSPLGTSTLTLYATDSGPEIELGRGSRRKVISEHTGPRSTAVLPPVSARGNGQVGLVDLTLPAIQEIGNGFMVVQLGLAKQGTGVRVSGRVINSTSVQHAGIQFGISVGGQSQRFDINLISPGNSTGFAVDIPDVRLDDAKTAQIRYLRSTVNYFSHSLKGNQGLATARPQ
jgi:hypothetical protein